MIMQGDLMFEIDNMVFVKKTRNPDNGTINIYENGENIQCFTHYGIDNEADFEETCREYYNENYNENYIENVELVYEFGDFKFEKLEGTRDVRVYLDGEYIDYSEYRLDDRIKTEGDFEDDCIDFVKDNYPKYYDLDI